MFRGTYLVYLLSLLLLVNMSNRWGVCSGILRNGGGGLRCGPNSKKGVLGAGLVKKGGLYRGTGHIYQCPSPQGLAQDGSLVQFGPTYGMGVGGGAETCHETFI